MLLGEMGLYNSILTSLYRKQLSRESSPPLCVSLIFSHSLFPSSLVCSSLAWLSTDLHHPLFHNKLAPKPLKSQTVSPPKIYAFVYEYLLEPTGTSGPTLLHWHNWLLGMLVNTVTLLSGWQPLCCHGSTQANGGAVLMIMLCLPAVSLSFSHTHIQIHYEWST